MKVCTLTGATAYQNIAIEKPVIKLLLQKDTGDFASTEKITVRIERKQGSNIDLIVSQSIKELSQFSELHEGPNKVVALAGAERTILLAVAAPVYLALEDRITIEFSGLDAARTYIVYGLEGMGTGKTAWKYSAQSIPANTNTRLISPANTLQAIGFATTHLSYIQLNFSDGTQANYTPDECSYIMRDTNGLALVGGVSTDIVASQEDLVILGLNNVSSIQIYTDNSEFDYFVTEAISL